VVEAWPKAMVWRPKVPLRSAATRPRPQVVVDERRVVAGYVLAVLAGRLRVLT